MSTNTYLADSAMLFSYTIHEFGNTSLAWSASARKALRDTLGETSSLGTHSIPLFPSDQLRGIKQAVRNLRTFVTKNSLPWTTHARIIPKKDLWKFINQFNEYTNALNVAVQEASGRYSEMLTVAERVHKNMFDVTLYPTSGQEFAKHYSVDKHIATITQTTDIWQALPESLIASIDHDFEKQQQQRFEYMLRNSEAYLRRIAVSFVNGLEYLVEKGQVPKRPDLEGYLAYLQQYRDLAEHSGVENLATLLDREVVTEVTATSPVSVLRDLQQVLLDWTKE